MKHKYITNQIPKLKIIRYYQILLKNNIEKIIYRKINKKYNKKQKNKKNYRKYKK